MAERGITVYTVGAEPALGSIPYARDFMRAVAKITEGYFLALGNPSLLAKAIIGGALQEVSMEALMEEMRIEVEKESENLRNQNKEVVEEEVVKVIAERMKERKIETNQLEVESIYERELDDENMDAMLCHKSISSVAGHLKMKEAVAVKSSKIGAPAPSSRRFFAREEKECKKKSTSRSRTSVAASPSSSSSSMLADADCEEAAQAVHVRKSEISTEQVSKMWSKGKNRGMWK